MKRVWLLGIVLVFIGIVGLLRSGHLDIPWQAVERQLLPIGVTPSDTTNTAETTKVMIEESVVIDVVDKTTPSVVTIGVIRSRSARDIFSLDPFGMFGQLPRQQLDEPEEQDIGTGFIVSSDGLLVTNKHVVDDPDATYRVITSDDTRYDVQNIYRDPTNDLAILKINANNLTPITLGDSSQIKVGQLAIAIGTALGEFRHTVTTGVISGVGRGITAGSPFQGFVERLDNVIQTDAAINPGNSGGPLLNSAGQVVGVNTAVSASGQNIGFAIPINVVKDAIENFNQTGQFNRPFLGIRYRTVSRDIALLNDLPEGAFVLEVISGSPAAGGGIQVEDIITDIDGVRLSGDTAELAVLLATKKVGDTVTVKIWRNGEELELRVTLASQEQ